MKNKTKTILFLLILFITLLTLISINATGDNNQTTTITTDTSQDIQQTIIQTTKTYEDKKIMKTQNKDKKIKNTTKNTANKTTITNKTQKTSSYTSYAYGYDDLYNKIESSKTYTHSYYYSDREVSIYLQKGDYNITKPIYWGNSNTKTLKIYANNNLFDANHMKNFITVENGYTLELHDFKIRYAQAQRGSVIYNKGTVDITNSIFLNSTATKNGGVIYNDNGKITITGSSFSNNKAENGAVIYNNNANTQITSSYFSYNQATRGGVNYNIGILKIASTTFKNNQVIQNGGVNYNDKYNITIIKSNFQNNKATNYGGCNYNNKYIYDIDCFPYYPDYPTISINASQFTNNNAKNGGVNANYGLLTIQSSNLNNNNAIRGGVNYNFKEIHINKSTFKNNKVTTHGGVNYNEVYRHLEIEDSTFKDNTAQQNGGVNYNNQGEIYSILSKYINNSAMRGGVNYNDGRIGMYKSNFTQNKATKNGGVNYDNEGCLCMEKINSLKNTAERGGNTYCNKKGILYFNSSFFEDDKAKYDAEIIINYGEDSYLIENLFIVSKYNNQVIIYTTKKMNMTNNEFDITGNPVKENEIKTIKSPIKDLSKKNQHVEFTFLHDNEDHLSSKVKNDGTASVNYKFKCCGFHRVFIDYDYEKMYIYIFQQVILKNTVINVYNDDDLAEAFYHLKEEPTDRNFTINICKNIKLEYSTEWGYTDAVKKITIKGNNHIINGQNKTQFLLINPGYTVNIENLKVQNCMIPWEVAGDYYDGGAICNNGTLNIKNSEFKNNEGDGGAICNYGKIIIQKTNITNNIGIPSGSAIFNHENATLRISYSNIVNNHAMGGVLENWGGYMYVDHSSFKNNGYTDGGVIDNAGGYIEVTYNNFTNNEVHFEDDYSGIIFNTYKSFGDNYEIHKEGYGYVAYNQFKGNKAPHSIKDPDNGLTLVGNRY